MKRPKTTQMVIDSFATILDAQDLKGLEKYGVTIDDAKHKDYDWNLMALEEVADCFKYLVKENQKLRVEIKQYQSQETYLIARLKKAEETLKRFVDLPSRAWSDMARKALEGAND